MEKQKQKHLEERLYRYAELLTKEFEDAKRWVDQCRQSPQTLGQEQLVASKHRLAIYSCAKDSFYEYFPEFRREDRT
jgi:hypothetical protein